MNTNAEPFPPSNPNQLSIVVGGRVLSGQDLKSYAQRHGLCEICGLYQTHRRVGKLLRSSWEPVTRVTEDGVTTVYKGFCIQPTCYPSVDHVKELLGETKQRRRRRTSTKTSNFTGTVAIASDVGAGMNPGTIGAAQRVNDLGLPRRTSDNSTVDISFQSGPLMAAPSNPPYYNQRSQNLPQSNAGTGDEGQSTLTYHHLNSACAPRSGFGFGYPLPNTSPPQTSPSSLAALSDSFGRKSGVGFAIAPTASHSRTETSGRVQSKQQVPNDSSTYPTGGGFVLNPHRNQSAPTSNLNKPCNGQQLQGDLTANSSNLLSVGEFDTIRTGWGHLLRENSDVSGTSTTPSQGFSRDNTSIANHSQPTYSNSVSNKSHNSFMSASPVPVGGLSLVRTPQVGATPAGKGATDTKFLIAPATEKEMEPLEQHLFDAEDHPRYSHPVLDELYDFISDADYINFLNTLELKGTEPEIVVEGFQLFCTQVVADQRAKPSAVIVPGGEWVKTLKRNMERFRNHNDVFIHGLLCMITLSTLQEKYKRAIVKKGGMDIVNLVFKHHDKNPQLLELGTAFLYTISADDRDGLNAKAPLVVTVIRNLAELIQSLCQGPSRSFACLCLWNLANQKKKSESTGKSLAHDVQSVLVGPEMVSSLVDLLSSCFNCEENGYSYEIGSWTSPSSLASIGLLQMCLFPKDSLASDHNCNSRTSEERDLSSSPEVLNHVMDLLMSTIQREMRRYSLPTGKEIPYLEAVCGLLANLALPKPNTTHFPGSVWRKPVVEILSDLLTKYLEKCEEGLGGSLEEIEGLFTAGIHAMCNWLAKKCLVGRQRGGGCANSSAGSILVTVLGKCMSCFETNSELQELACLSLAYACRPGQDPAASAEFAVLDGSLERVDTALQNLGALFESEETRNEPPYLQLRRAALSAMASLACSSVGARRLVDSGRLEHIEILVAVEQDDEMKPLIQTILGRCHDIYTGGIPGFAGLSFRTDPSSRGRLLKQHPKSFPHILESVDSEDSAICLLYDLAGWINDSRVDSSGFPPLLTYPGIDLLLETMRLFSESMAIQKAGCGILAFSYFYIPYKIGGAAENNVSPEGRWELIQVQDAIDTLRGVMQRHRNDAATQDYACRALSNFLGPLCEAATCRRNGPEATRELDDLEVVKGLVDPCLKDLLTTMTIHQDNSRVQRSAIQLFWTLSFVCHEDNMKRWTLRVVQQIFQAMKEFPSDVELNVFACDALLAFQNDSEALDFFGSADGMKSLLCIVTESKNEMIMAGAAAVMACTLKKIFTASGHILQVPNSLQRIVFFMKDHAANSSIQLHACSILESLSIVEDYGVQYAICEAGGLETIVDSLSIHASNELVVELACRLLAIVVPAAEANVFSSCRNRLGTALIHVFENHVASPRVQSTALDCLWACCRQDEYFQILLIKETNCVDIVVQSMSSHLSSPDVQRSGCNLIRMMAGSSPRQFQDGCWGERGAVAAVVNGMCAHPESSSVQKEALRALKCLATISSNKPLISSVDGEKAVMNSLWIHIRDSQVVTAAFSALNNIAVDSESRTVGPLNDDSMRAIVMALSKFPRDESVQKQGCFLLKSCSYLDFNLQLMRQHGGQQLTKLLHHAARMFPDQCQSRAMGVVAKMDGR